MQLLKKNTKVGVSILTQKIVFDIILTGKKPQKNAENSIFLKFILKLNVSISNVLRKSLEGYTLKY